MQKNTRSFRNTHRETGRHTHIIHTERERQRHRERERERERIDTTKTVHTERRQRSLHMTYQNNGE